MIRADVGININETKRELTTSFPLLLNCEFALCQFFCQLYFKFICMLSHIANRLVNATAWLVAQACVKFLVPVIRVVILLLSSLAASSPCLGD